MRELQTCDFCGTDPVGVYEPLPASLADDQHRVALCGDCRDTLGRVLAPLDAVDADPEPATPDRGDATPDADEPATLDATDEAVTIDRPADDESDADDDGSADADADDGARAVSRPPGYGQVLRLVRNRDESLSRDALEALASSAYDVSEPEARRAIDAAVENGDLAEVDGELRPA